MQCYLEGLGLPPKVVWFTVHVCMPYRQAGVWYCLDMNASAKAVQNSSETPKNEMGWMCMKPTEMYSHWSKDNLQPLNFVVRLCAAFCCL